MPFFVVVSCTNAWTWIRNRTSVHIVEDLLFKLTLISLVPSWLTVKINLRLLMPLLYAMYICYKHVLVESMVCGLVI